MCIRDRITIRNVIDLITKKTTKDGVSVNCHIGFVYNTAYNALAHYWKTKIKPYLKLRGPVEIDEAKVGADKGIQKGLQGHHPVFKVT